jgi:autotransporter-associated beta strand protein
MSKRYPLARFAILIFVLTIVSALSFAAASGERLNYLDSVREYFGQQKVPTNAEPEAKKAVYTAALPADATRILWSAPSSSPWLTASNWTGGAVPTNSQIAQFGTNPTSGTLGVGINFGSTTNAGTQINGQRVEEVGAIEVVSPRSADLFIGNSSGTAGATGKLRPLGVTVNGIDNVILRNNSAATFTIQDRQGASGTQTMGLELINATNNIVNIDGTGGIVISSIISGPGKKLTLSGSGSGTLMLSGANTFSGDTIIAKGILSLIGSASIANSPAIEIQGGAGLDVLSLVTPLTLASGQALKASGTTSSGTIYTSSTKGLTTAIDSPLLFTAFNGTTPPLKVSNSGGALTLQAGNPVTVTVAAGSPLGVGDYKLIAKANGASVAGTAPTSLTVNGDGLAAGTAATLQIVAGELFLHVVSATPVIGVTPASISFGNQQVSVSSSPQNISISNTGNGPLTINNITFTGTDSGDFSTTAVTPIVLNPNASTSIPITFTPGAAGSRSGQIDIASNDPVSPTKSVSLNGTGVQPSILQLSSSSYAEDESQTLQIIVTRSGDTTGTSTVDLLTSGGDAVGGASCTVGVDYVSTSVGLTFVPSETSKTIQIPICSDMVVESVETFGLSISNPGSGTTLGSPASATVSINDTASEYRSTDPIAFNSSGAAAPYPSTINVSGATPLVGSMRVTLFDVHAAFADDIDILLVGPQGQMLVLMSDAGGSDGLASASTLTFTDSTGLSLPDAGTIPTGQYRTTNWAPDPDSFLGAPAGPYGDPATLTNPFGQTFAGTDPNGTWSLYVMNDNESTLGSGATDGIVGGWGIEFVGVTAAQGGLSGRVMSADGSGIRNAFVTVSGRGLSQPLSARTDGSGKYSVDGLLAGQDYIVTVEAKGFTFAKPTVLMRFNGDGTEMNFIAEQLKKGK